MSMEDAINNLAAAIRYHADKTGGNTVAAPASEPAPKTTRGGKDKTKDAETTTPPPPPTTTATTPPPPPAAQPAATTPPPPPAAAPTTEEAGVVRAKLAAMIRPYVATYGRDAVIAALGTVKAGAAKQSDIPDAQVGDAVAALEKLGPPKQQPPANTEGD